MAAGSLDITIEQDADFQIELTLSSSGTAIDITGYTWAGQIRETRSTDGTLVGNFTFVDITSTDGRVDMIIESSDTNDFKCGDFHYDIEYQDSTTKVRLLQGKATVSAQITATT